MNAKLYALADMLECSLRAAPGSFAFLFASADEKAKASNAMVMNEEHTTK